MRDTSSSFAHFLARGALVLVCGIVAVMALVVVIDPYGLYGLVGPYRFNTVKPSLTRYQEQIKQVRARKLRPDIVILGNSRAEIGFNPQAPALLADGRHAYNLAVAGTGPDVTLRQLRQLKADGLRPKTLIIGVEFLDFLPIKGVPVPMTAPDAATTITPGNSADLAFWKFDSLFSLASVKDALETLRIQHDGEAATTDMDGFNPLNEYRGYVRRDGYPKIFAQRAGENARAFHRKVTTMLRPDNLQRLHAILETAASMDADIKIVIYPYHAQIQAMFEHAGLEPMFEQWKHELIRTVAQTGHARANVRIAVVDFSGFGIYNCEHIPQPGETGVTTRWYWEGGHFKQALGDIVLARLMSGQTSPTTPFGFDLSADTESLNIQRISAERTNCAAAEPATFANAQQLMKMAATGH